VDGMGVFLAAFLLFGYLTRTQSRSMMDKKRVEIEKKNTGDLLEWKVVSCKDYNLAQRVADRYER
jgi:hypothetical protein